MHVVWEWFTGWGGWDEVGTGAVYSAAWLVTVCLVLVGLVGCVIPALPGHVFIFLAAVSHRLILRADSGVEWWTFVVLGALLAASQAFEVFSGAVGSKWFGGTRWGAAGALIGGIVGMFFMPFGLLLGPLVGAVAFEMGFAKKKARPATASGVGSLVGVAAGMTVKLLVGLLMSLWLLVDIFWIG